MVGYLVEIKEGNMGKELRKTSGKIVGGSTLIVPDQQVYSVKVFPPTFKYKQTGTKKDSDSNNSKNV